jgi:hypothetical protein
MKTYKHPGIIFLILSAICASCFAQSVTPKIYYCIIANEHYSLDYNKFEEGFSGLINVEEASIAADKIEAIFKQWGATKGIVLKSTKTTKLDSKMLLGSIDKIISTIKKDKTKNPLLLFYYAGHGFSSEKLQALFLPDGEFTKNPDLLTLENWDKYATVALDLHEKLQQADIEHMMFFDCCYSGRQLQIERLSPNTINQLNLKTLDQLMGDTYSILTAMYRMVGPDPVIFSTSAGKSVQTLPLYDGMDSEYVPPLCRRLLLLNQQNAQFPMKQISEWMKVFLNKNFDPPTAQAVSYWSGSNE